jgi:hypothetical protein
MVIGGVMVIMLASNAVGRVKPQNIKLVFVASPLSTVFRRKSKDWFGATCLSVDCCLSELAL